MNNNGQGPSRRIGKAGGDAKLESDGKGDKIEGKVQNAVGGLKDTSERNRRRGCLLVLPILDSFTPGANERFQICAHARTNFASRGTCSLSARYNQRFYTTAQRSQRPRSRKRGR